MDLCEKHLDKDELDKAKTVAEVFWTTKDFYMPPICAFIGGVVAQEVIKGITQKFTPIKQEFYFDVIELFEKNEDKLSTG
jgi:ubiquitin-activating enzyme E1